MSNQTNIEKLITSGKQVFTTDDLAVIWEVADRKKLLGRIKHYQREKRLINVHKGIYAYGEYSAFDVAQKLVPLSYLSLYTTAQMHGLTFQYYSTVFCVSLRSKTFDLAGQKFAYRKVKDSIFYNSLGLVTEARYTIANRERTICDLLYVYPGFSFDNLKGVDTDLLQKISLIYGNKRLERDVAKLITDIADR